MTSLKRLTVPGVAMLVLAGCGNTPSMEIFQPGRPAPAADIDAAACVLIDTDMALDDARALAAVVPTNKVAMVVVTGGVARAEHGATAAVHLLATSRKTIPILIGGTSSAPTTPDWLQQGRESAERLGYLLAASVPLDPSEAFYLEHEVQVAVRGCETVDVLQLGPWTSFVLYAPGLGRKLRRVIAQGVPPLASEVPGFNCSYDLQACRAVLADETLSGKITWVALPASADQGFVPDPAMFRGLATTGMPATVRLMMTIDPSLAANSYIGDDTVALYWLYPELFSSQGGHVEPKVPAAELKEAWRIAVNDAIERRS
jgi:inosine-uridine nucleoside N-ribohydrolase